MAVTEQGGAPVPLDVVIRNASGSLTDPDTLTLVGKDPAGTVWLSLTLAGITRLGIGHYGYSYAPAADAAFGGWSFTWDGTVEGLDVDSQTVIVNVVPLGSLQIGGTYTYDLATNVGKLRLILQDNDLSSVAAAIPLSQRSATFTDEELAAILSFNYADLYLSASVACRALATNKNLIVIARKIGATAIDYGKIRSDLLKVADDYRKVALETPADDVADINWDDFRLRQIYINDWLRGLVQ